MIVPGSHALNTLSGLPLGDEISFPAAQHLKNPILQMGGDSLLSETKAAEAFQAAIIVMAQRVKPVLTALASIVAPEAEAQFSVRMPTSEHKSFASQAKEISDLSKMIEQPVRRLLKSDIYIVGVDRGSAWLEIVGAAVTALPLVKAIFSGSERLLKLKADMEMRHERARKLRLQNDALEAQVQFEKAALEAQRQILIRRVINVAEKAHRGETVDVKAEIIDAELVEEEPIATTEFKDPEAASMIRISLDVGAELLQRGAALQLPARTEGNRSAARPTIEAPPELLRLSSSTPSDGEPGEGAK